MHFVTGEVVAIYQENGLRMGRVRVGGVLTRVSLELLPDLEIGDVVLAHAGVALSKVDPGDGSGREGSDRPPGQRGKAQ